MEALRHHRAWLRRVSDHLRSVRVELDNTAVLQRPQHRLLRRRQLRLRSVTHPDLRRGVVGVVDVLPRLVGDLFPLPGRSWTRYGEVTRPQLDTVGARGRSDLRV